MSINICRVGFSTLMVCLLGAFVSINVGAEEIKPATNTTAPTVSAPSTVNPADTASSGTTIQSPIFKCRDKNGTLLFQDFPCRGGESLPTPEIDKSTTPKNQISSYLIQKNDAQNLPNRAIEYKAEPQREKMPTLFACVRYDGSLNITETPDTTMRLVPESLVDRPETISSGYVKIDAGKRQPEALPEADMAWVQDHCKPMDPIEVCRHLGQRREQVRSDLRRAFEDTRLSLSQERDRLDAILDGHCGAL